MFERPHPAIDAVIFDFGGVLTTSPFAAMARAAAQHGIDPALFATIAVGAGTYGSGAHPWHRLERGEIDLDEFNAATQHLARDHGLDGFPALPAREQMAAASTVRRGMVDLAARVRATGRRTAICTNNVRAWHGWQAVLPIEEFDVVVDSCTVGMRKPEPRIYRYTADLLGVPVTRCLFLDDMADNVRGARAVGMHAIEVDHTLHARDRTLALLASSCGRA